jgi:hypothetical protein
VSFANPLFLYLAAVAAAGIIALHVIARQRPPSSLLPTARFVPEFQTRVTSRTPRPSDPGLLLLRLLMIALVGVALAAPVFESRSQAVRRVLLLDVSSDASSVEEVRDSAAVYFSAGDAVVLSAGSTAGVRDGIAGDTGIIQLDSLPVELTYQAASAQGGRTHYREGSLTTGLLGALRAARIVAHDADSVELVLVSPLLESQFDAATLDVRELWPGRIRVVRVAARGEPAAWSREVDARMDPDDPISATLSLLGVRSDRGEGASVRLVRGEATAEDSAWLLAGPAVEDAQATALPDPVATRTLVIWPDEDAMAALDVREPVDTIGGVVISRRAIVASFPRSARPGAGRAIAHWADGEPAAVERMHGEGCLREVTIPVTPIGDLTLRHSFLHLTDELLRPCGVSRNVAAASDSLASLIAGAGALAPAAQLRGEREHRSAAAPWLLGFAIFLAALEPLVRDRRRKDA